jgi:hypothetical protein
MTFQSSIQTISELLVRRSTEPTRVFRELVRRQNSDAKIHVNNSNSARKQKAGRRRYASREEPVRHFSIQPRKLTAHPTKQAI